MSNGHSLIGGVCLVAGTTIGAGMLALPLATGLAGFVPGMVLFLAAWIFMTYTALLMLEARLWVDGDTNLVTMAKHTLGKGGQVFAWVVYLFLLYALTTAYIAGSGPIFLDVASYLMPEMSLPAWAGAAPLLLIFGYFVYHGVHSVDGINRALMVGMFVTYSLIAFVVTPHVDGQLLQHTNWNVLPLATSVVVTSFGYHIIIPTLLRYMDGDVVLTRRAILIGSCLPLVVYVGWVLLALGVIPLEGDGGLMDGYARGLNSAALVGDVIGSHRILLLVRAFSFFAIVTSFLGVSLSLRDFLADGLGIEKSRRGRVLLMLLTFGPPLAITFSYPRAFLSALEYAGAFGVISLLALLPALMVWWGRYRLGYQPFYRAPGGKNMLRFVVIISLIVIGLEICGKLDLYTPR